MAVGEPFEGRTRLRVAGQSFGEVGGYRNLPRLLVELDLDAYLVASRHAGHGAVLGANSDEVLVAVDCDGAAVGVTADRDPNRRALAASQRGDDLSRDTHPGCRLAGQLNRRAEPHQVPPCW